MRGKLIQILNNILEEEVKVEENMIATRFKKEEKRIFSYFDAKVDLLNNIYSFDQVSKKCIDELRDFYPKYVYYSPIQKVDNQHGREVCSKYLMKNYMRNARMRKICIEESYKEAMAYALKEWKSDEHYEYFATKEDELVRHMWALMKPKVNIAIK
jgi:hypothetical protein